MNRILDKKEILSEGQGTTRSSIEATITGMNRGKMLPVHRFLTQEVD